MLQGAVTAALPSSIWPTSSTKTLEEEGGDIICILKQLKDSMPGDLKQDLDGGVGKQGPMFGYAIDEPVDTMPLTRSIATRLGRKFLPMGRKTGDFRRLRPRTQNLPMKLGQRPFAAKRLLGTLAPGDNSTHGRY